MFESNSELLSLQKLLDSSKERAGKHLLDIFHPITAKQLCRKFVGVRQVAWATVNSKREPRVAPVDAVFIHGRFYLSTDQTALRTRHLRRNPATSLTYFEDITFAVVVHGKARVLDNQEGDEFKRAFRLFELRYGREMMEGGKLGLVFIRVDPRLIFTHKLPTSVVKRVNQGGRQSTKAP